MGWQVSFRGGAADDREESVHDTNEVTAMTPCSSDDESPGHFSVPLITVVKKREKFLDRWRNRLRAVGIGIGVLFLFVGLGVIREIVSNQQQCDSDDGVQTMPISETRSGNRNVRGSVASAVDCLLSYLKLPTERRLRTLSESLGKCPNDFQDAVREYLVSIAKTSEDMIPAREREEMIKGKAVLGLLFGAVNSNDPQGGVAAGLQMGDLICAEVEQKAKMRLRHEIESKINCLVEVAQKYGIDGNVLEEVLLSR